MVQAHCQHHCVRKGFTLWVTVETKRYFSFCMGNLCQFVCNTGYAYLAMHTNVIASANHQREYYGMASPVRQVQVIM